MTLDEIKQLIDFIRDRELSEFELERADFKLRVKSGVRGALRGAARVRGPGGRASGGGTCRRSRLPRNRRARTWRS